MDRKIFKKNNTRYARAFNNWVTQLFEIVLGIFQYENLPANLPAYEIERRLIFDGFCGIFKSELYGLVCADGGLSGVGIYNLPTQYNYAQAVLGSGNLEINIDCAVIYGCTADMYSGFGSAGARILHYADMLANIDVSRQISLINSRAINSVSARSDNGIRELNTMYRKILDGDLYIPKIDTGVLDATENIFKNARAEGINILDFDTSIQNVLKMFYSSFGIKFSTEKRERLISDEIAADNDALDANLRDMLAARIRGIDTINSMYGTAITVGVNTNDIV